MNKHSVKSILFSLLLLTLAASLVSGALADVYFRTDGDLKESEKGGSVNCNTTDILVPGMDIEFSSDFVGDTDAYDIVQGYSVYINGQLYNYYAQKILDCRVPFQVWHSTMIDEKMVYANVVVKTTVGNAYYDYYLTVKEGEVKPLCDEHILEFNMSGIRNAVYTKCENTPGKYYLSSCTGNYRCVVCGMETAWTVFRFSEENSPSIVDHPDGSSSDSIFEDMPVDTGLTNQLRQKAHSLISNVYTDMAESNENDPVYQAASESLRILTDPVGGTYDLAVDLTTQAQEKEVLERALIEMLYGMEYGNTTYSELAQLVDKSGNVINDCDFSIVTDLMEAKGGMLTDTVQGMAESIEYAVSTTRGAEALASFDLQFFSSEEAAHLHDSFVQYMEQYPAVEGTERFFEMQRTEQDLKELQNIMEQKESQANSTYKVKGISIGVNALFTALGIACNYFVAEDRVDQTKNSVNEQLYALTAEKLQKIQILDHLQESMDPSSMLYSACEQVKSDIENDLNDLNSTDRRKELQEDGRLLLKFSCGTAVTVFAKSAASKIAGPVLTVTGISNVAADGLTGGGITDARDSADTVENILFIHRALESMDQENLSFYQSELYYILAKKELDYASDFNRIIYGKSWLTSRDEEERLTQDRTIIAAQKELLDAQNEIRTSFFEEKGLSFEAENNYDPEQIDRYLDGKYDFRTGSGGTIPSYINTNILGGIHDPVSELNLFGWTLKDNTRYEILAINKNDKGERILKVADTEGKVSYIKAADLPDSQELLEDKYNLYVDVTEKAIPVYIYPDNGFTSNVAGAVLGMENHLSPNSDYAAGYYHIMRMIVDNNEYYYWVRDTWGSDWYLKVSDAQYFMQNK